MPDDERYTWCNSCGACVNERAKRCRFCGALVTAAACTTSFPGAATCSDAIRWLPQFAELLDAMPPGQLKHLLLTAEAAQTKQMKSIPAIDSLIGYQLPPEPKVQELIKLVLTKIHGTAAFDRLEGHSRLQLIKLTHDTVNNELSLLPRESRSAVRCAQCGERILAAAEICRFCGADRSGTPTVSPWAKPDIDELFLRAMLTHIAASERLDPCSPPMLDQLVGKYGISESEIAVEEGRLSSSFFPSYQQELPLTTWENHLIAAGHDHDRTQYSAVRSLIELAKSCRLNERPDEARLLMAFAGSLIFRRETDEFLRDFMLADFRAEGGKPASDTAKVCDTEYGLGTDGGAIS